MSAVGLAAVRARRPVDDVSAVIERFIAACSRPVFLEPGEDPFPLVAGCYSLDRTPRGLTLSCWDSERMLTRCVARAMEAGRGRLAVTTVRFGKREGSATIADLAVRQDVSRDGRRLKFREQFRRFLSRQYAGWRIAEVSTGADLEHSLSPAYARALLTRGQSSFAAIGAPFDSLQPEGALTFGLIWLDYLRRRNPNRYVEGLAVFVPEDASRVTCDRVRHLQGGRFQVFAHSEEGGEHELDLADYGNFTTRIEPCASTMPLPAWLHPALLVDGADVVLLAGGGMSLRIRGLEFARVAGGWGEGPRVSFGIGFGIDRMRPASEVHATEILALARSLAEMRRPDGDPVSALFRRTPEAWLEAQMRWSIEQVDANLFASPVYGQVPAFTAGDRGVIDLVAADRDGRLAVLELKASADIHLPLQALDYWMRVRWHLERDEFGKAGYFPGIHLRRDPPKLYLVAPAMEFHPANETVLRYFTSAIQVERVGLSLEWRRRLRVVCRSGETGSFQNSSFHPSATSLISGRTGPNNQYVTGRSQGNPQSDHEPESG